MNVRVAWIAVGLFALGTIGPAGFVSTEDAADVSLTPEVGAEHVCISEPEVAQNGCMCVHLYCMDLPVDVHVGDAVRGEAELASAPDVAHEHPCGFPEPVDTACWCIHVFQCLEELREEVPSRSGVQIEAHLAGPA